MKKSILYITLLLIISLCVTACGGSSSGKDQSSSAAVSGEAISETKQKNGGFPTEMKAKTPYYFDTDIGLFTIKEHNSQEYRAEVSLHANTEDIGDPPEIHWELYLELADEIKDISGATIVSHEGTHYIIRGEQPKHAPDDGWDEDHVDFKVSFEITVSWQGQIHEPQFCFLSKELSPVPAKKYDCEFTSLKKDGENVNGTIRLSNRSGKKIPGWELNMDSNFRLTSVDDGYTSYGGEYIMDDDEERLWYQTICGNGKNFDLEAGETKEISFTGNCPAERPKIKGRFELVEQTDMSDTETWDVLESRYGARYGKMETYLVADTVWGTDLLFVFDEKTADGYTATAELTNVVPVPLKFSENEDDSGQAMDAIADWEIYLECEDTIENITGAEIVSHEGNVYHIRTTDPTQWIAPYSFTTFQVKVSSPTGIHPLGKTYLKRAKMRASDDSNAVEREQEFSFDKDAFQNATGSKWLSYNEFYDSYLDDDCFEDYEELKSFYEREEWGRKNKR